jgi:hypothetical protein
VHVLPNREGAFAFVALGVGAPLFQFQVLQVQLQQLILLLKHLHLEGFLLQLFFPSKDALFDFVDLLSHNIQFLNNLRLKTLFIFQVLVVFVLNFFLAVVRVVFGLSLLRAFQFAATVPQFGFAYRLFLVVLLKIVVL